MKLTELRIAPKSDWSKVGPDNPMICTVKLNSENATVQTVLSDEQVQRVIALVQGIVAEAARVNVAAFVASVNQIEGPGVEPRVLR